MVATQRNLSVAPKVIMLDKGDVVFSAEQEEWIKELMSGIQQRREEEQPITSTSSSAPLSTAGNLRELTHLVRTTRQLSHVADGGIPVQ